LLFNLLILLTSKLKSPYESFTMANIVNRGGPCSQPSSYKETTSIAKAKPYNVFEPKGSIKEAIQDRPQKPITSESVCLGVHEALRLGFDPVDVRKNYMTLVEGGNCARDLDALPLLDSPTSI
jgi:hypothetical protein